MPSVRKSPLEAELINKLEPVLEQMGYGLRDIEVAIQGGVVRIVLEPATPQSAPIGIDDCSKVHQQVSPLFDVWDPVPGAYTLEISSPGESPSLRTLRHFQEAVGSEIFCQTADSLPMPAPAKPRKNWDSKLVGVIEAENVIELEDNLGRHRLKIDQILRASWKRDWSLKPASKPKKAESTKPEKRR